MLEKYAKLFSCTNGHARSWTLRQMSYRCSRKADRLADRISEIRSPRDEGSRRKTTAFKRGRPF